MWSSIVELKAHVPERLHVGIDCSILYDAASHQYLALSEKLISKPLFERQVEGKTSSLLFS
jgi:hypothetical protein